MPDAMLLGELVIANLLGFALASRSGRRSEASRPLRIMVRHAPKFVKDYLANYWTEAVAAS